MTTTTTTITATTPQCAWNDRSNIKGVWEWEGNGPSCPTLRRTVFSFVTNILQQIFVDMPSTRKCVFSPRRLCIRQQPTTTTTTTTKADGPPPLTTNGAYAITRSWCKTNTAVQGTWYFFSTVITTPLLECEPPPPSVNSHRPSLARNERRRGFFWLPCWHLLLDNHHLSRSNARRRCSTPCHPSVART